MRGSSPVSCPAALQAWKAAQRLPGATKQHWAGLGGSLHGQDDSVPVPKNAAPPGLPPREQREQLRCRSAVLEEENRAAFLLITQSYF